VFSRRAWLELRRLVLSDAGGNGFDHRVKARRVEIRDRVPLQFALAVEDAVHGRAIDAVRPAGHQVAQVDDEGVGDGRCRDPFVRGVSHFQSPDIVLGQQRDASPVRVRARADLVELGHLGLRWIAQDAQNGARPVVVAGKPVALEIEGLGDQREQVVAQLPHLGLVGDHLIAKAGQ